MKSKTSKTTPALSRTLQVDELTCSEGQVEDVLSEGESTEVEARKKGAPGRLTPKKRTRRTD